MLDETPALNCRVSGSKRAYRVAVLKQQHLPCGQKSCRPSSDRNVGDRRPPSGLDLPRAASVVNGPDLLGIQGSVEDFQFVDGPAELKGETWRIGIASDRSDCQGQPRGISGYTGKGIGVTTTPSTNRLWVFSLRT